MKSRIDQTLYTLLPNEDPLLFEAARYSLEEGKRLRPLLTLSVVEAFSSPIEKALQPACALEMIHTYSLIHDDLPCMDDDDFRRNRPSLHKAYKESTAVLTGDFLLTLAFEVLANAPHLTEEEKNRLISILALRSGSQGMIGGQVLDLEKTQENEHELLALHKKKTGALITAALEFGGVLSAQEDLSLFQSLGQHLGLAYQLVDDLLDNDGSITLIGKTRTEELITYHFEKANDLIQTFPSSASLKALIEKMLFRAV